MNKNMIMGIVAILFGVVAIPIQISVLSNGTKGIIPWPILTIGSIIGMIFGGIAIYVDMFVSPKPEADRPMQIPDVRCRNHEIVEQLLRSYVRTGIVDLDDKSKDFNGIPDYLLSIVAKEILALLSIDPDDYGT